jgi:hypothetical protein
LIASEIKEEISLPSSNLPKVVNEQSVGNQPYSVPVASDLRFRIADAQSEDPKEFFNTAPVSTSFFYQFPVPGEDVASTRAVFGSSVVSSHDNGQSFK